MARFALALWVSLLAPLWLALPSPVAAQGTRVSMSASSNRVAVGEPFAVEVRIQLAGDEPDDVELPDFGELQVLGRSTSRPFSFSFGFGSGGQRAQVKSETIYGFTLRATEPGAYTIRPAIVTVKGRRIASQALNILVLDPAQGQPGGAPSLTPGGPRQADEPDRAPEPPQGALDGATFDPTMFLRTVVDKKRAYLGEQVTVTVYLYVRGQIGDNPSITREPTLDGFWSQDLLPMQRSLTALRQDVNGRPFNAYVLRRFAAFPLRTGTLEIGAPAVEVGAGGSLFDLLTGPTKQLRRDGVKVSVEVLPLPAQPTPGAPVHTGTLQLTAALDASEAKVGEAVTLRVTAKGRGNFRSLTLPNPRVPGIEALAPELSDRLTHELDQIGGERVFRWLLLPRQSGSYAIPSMVVDVFDPVSGQFSTVRSTPLTLNVTAASASASTGASTGVSPGDESDLSGPRFGPARPESELARRGPLLSQRAFFWPTVLAAPLLLLGALAVRFGRRKLAQRGTADQDQQALRALDKQLDEAARASHAGDAQSALRLLASALKRALELRLGEPVGGMTSSALERHLLARGMEPKLSARAIAQLGALERARFDPLAQGTLELNRAVAGVRALVGELGRFRPRPVSARKEVA